METVNALVAASAAGAGVLGVVMAVPAAAGEGGDVVLAWKIWLVASRWE